MSPNALAVRAMAMVWAIPLFRTEELTCYSGQTLSVVVTLTAVGEEKINDPDGSGRFQI